VFFEVVERVLADESSELNQYLQQLVEGVETMLCPIGKSNVRHSGDLFKRW
jgi:hypothetical protein